MKGNIGFFLGPFLWLLLSKYWDVYIFFYSLQYCYRFRIFFFLSIVKMSSLETAKNTFFFCSDSEGETERNQNQNQENERSSEKNTVVDSYNFAQSYSEDKKKFLWSEITFAVSSIYKKKLYTFLSYFFFFLMCFFFFRFSLLQHFFPPPTDF